MSDDIVTRLREIADADVYMAHISVSKLYEAADQIERWRNIANRLGTHMGEGLYTDNWDAREYAISAYYEWESQPEAKLYSYDKPAEPLWYFKGGA